jgi:hypothetical protein
MAFRPDRSTTYILGGDTAVLELAGRRGERVDDLAPIHQEPEPGVTRVSIRATAADRGGAPAFSSWMRSHSGADLHLVGTAQAKDHL